jgi:hypothetical protein
MVNGFLAMRGQRADTITGHRQFVAGTLARDPVRSFATLSLEN